MGTYRFTVLDMVAEARAAAPQLTARLRIEETTGQLVHAIVLRCQVRIEPHRRPYDDGERDGLCGLLGERGRQTDTLRPFPWLQCATTVPGFTGMTEADLALPCTYDLEVIGARYLHALDAGDVPLALVFSGTVFTGAGAGPGVEQIPPGCAARHRLPVTVWRQLISAYFPNTGWVRLDAGVLASLARYRARHGLRNWDETVQTLLARAAPAADGEAT